MDKINIIVWGCNKFSACLHQLLEPTNLHIFAFVDDEHKHSQEFCTKPVYTPEELKANTTLDALPIVIAVDHFMFMSRPVTRLKNMIQFKAKLQEIISEYRIENLLLHPAALVDFLTLHYPNKVILFGLQGSGNVTFVNIFHTIYKKYLLFLFTRNKLMLFFELMCREYMNIVHQLVTEFIHLQGGHDVQAVAWKIGTSHFNCKFGANNQTSLYTFSTREHIVSFVSMYHQIPSREYLEKLREMHFKLYFVQRNPLDIILSGVNKSSGIDEKSGQMDTTTFQCIARWTIAQLKEWRPLVQDMPKLRYESLLENPVQVIKEMMKQVSVLPLGRIAKKIWAQIGFKQLPQSFKKHFWKGGHGKWTRYFANEHLLYLRAYGIEEVLSGYGYDDDLAEFRLRVNAIANEEKTAFTANLQKYEDRIDCYKDEKYSTFDFLQRTNGAENCWQGELLCFVCKDNEMRETVKAGLANEYVNRIVLAGAHPAYRLS